MLLHLEDFDLTGGRVKMFGVLFTLILFKRVNLDTERNPFFPSVLSHREFCADTVDLRIQKKGGKSWLNPKLTEINLWETKVSFMAGKCLLPGYIFLRKWKKGKCYQKCYLDKNWGSFWRVPKELDSVKLRRVSSGVNDTNRHGDIWNKST